MEDGMPSWSGFAGGEAVKAGTPPSRSCPAGTALVESTNSERHTSKGGTADEGEEAVMGSTASGAAANGAPAVQPRRVLAPHRRPYRAPPRYRAHLRRCVGRPRSRGGRAGRLVAPA